MRRKRPHEMHIRPLRQYIYHGALVASVAAALPWCVVLNTMEDWVRGKPLKTAVKESVLGFADGIFSLLVDAEDMSYLDVGEGIDI
jgi:hypothetical protein